MSHLIDLRILSAGDPGWGLSLLKTKEKRSYPFSVRLTVCFAQKWKSLDGIDSWSERESKFWTLGFGSK